MGLIVMKICRLEEYENIIVYRRDDEYAGWPFNCGLWNFGGGEILIGFVRNRCRYSSTDDVRHMRIQYDGGQLVVARSTDGGYTWPEDQLKVLIESKAELRAKIQYYTTNGAPLPKPKPLDLDTGMNAIAVEPPLGRETGPTAYFITRDKGYTWEGPYILWDQLFETIQARPSYILYDRDIMLFVQGLRYDEAARGYRMVEPEGRPMVLVSNDGAVNWRFLSYILPLNIDIPRICPYPAILGDGRIVVALRVLWPDWRFQWTELYVSEDEGLTWRFISRVNRWGAPASLTLLRDGRLLCVYGYRAPPYGIRARISSDGGATWGPEIIIRDDGGSSDLGYPRSTELPDGRILTAYYFNEEKDKVKCDGGVRYIAATIFYPPY
ncbi:MAG: sialidase family protein [Nitrososphaerota archaeon]|nr:sialidase family protein [Nitrososphaerota archaeon]